ncbi:MAG: hypothetical protein U5K51_16275 [Flavobacteriaceae bacterium]|nr:hypothetical protein [Flavobacteriaceae bacterium]
MLEVWIKRSWKTGLLERQSAKNERKIASDNLFFFFGLFEAIIKEKLIFI